MNRVLWIALCALPLVACSRENARNMAPPAAVMEMVTQDLRVPPRRPDDTLAYEHAVHVEIGKDLLAERLQDVQAACASNDSFGCSVLDMTLQRDQTVPSGTIRLRMVPAAVAPIIEIASKGGYVAARSAHAEDLAEPVSDTARELSMLVAQRDKLEGFLKSRDLKIDQLITLSKELSSVQADIDSARSKAANLRRRIDTELLTIEFRLPPRAFGAEQTPVRDAFRLFSTNFTEGVGMVITFVAVLLPWLIVTVLGGLLLRILWRALRSGWRARPLPESESG